MNRIVFLTSVVVLFATSSPVLAAEFWVSQDPTTKVCKVVEKMPDGKTEVMVGATSYPTAKEARAAKKVAQGAGVCTKKAK
jgi:hypothetical protein